MSQIKFDQDKTYLWHLLPLLVAFQKYGEKSEDILLNNTSVKIGTAKLECACASLYNRAKTGR